MTAAFINAGDLPCFEKQPCRLRYPHDRMGLFRSAVSGPPMTIDVDYPVLLENFREHMAPKRSESASFLIWYLAQYYRLEEVEAVDAVCDQPGDKGVDGIFINDNSQTITIFQSKISHRSDTALGDFALRNFLGTLRQFQSVETAEHLMHTAGSAQVAQLIRRSGLLEKLPSYELHGEFIANIDLDRNGADFLDRHSKRDYFYWEEGVAFKLYFR